jgi:hypothetical protein
VGGGFTSSTMSLNIKSLGPTSDEIWSVNADRTSGTGNWTLTATAICVTAL